MALGVDERYVGQIGTDEQHERILELMSELGRDSLRHTVAAILDIRVSKLVDRRGRPRDLTSRDAARVIEVLEARLDEEG